MFADRVKQAFQENSPNKELADDEMRTLVSLMMSKDSNLNQDVNDLDKESEFYKELKPLIESFQAQIFLQRIKHATSLKISLGVLIMLMHYLETAGSSVMYAYYMHMKLPENTLVNLRVFSMDLFPFGMFSNEQLNNIWDKQKVKKEDQLKGNDNLLDYPETWKNN